MNLLNELISYLINVLFIGFVKFEIKQRFSAYQDQFCVWLSLARLADCSSIFSEPFSKKRNSFIFLLPARLCFLYLFNASTIRILYISFAQSCKILLSKFSKLSALVLHCASLLRTIFASLARAHERVRVQNLRDFPQTKHDSEINTPFLLNEHGDLRFFYLVFAKNSLIKNTFEEGKKFDLQMVRLSSLLG